MVTKKKLTKEEWEAMTGTDMSLILPSDGSIETALESSLNDTGNSERAKSVEQVEVPFEPQQSPTGREEAAPALVSQEKINSLFFLYKPRSKLSKCQLTSSKSEGQR